MDFWAVWTLPSHSPRIRLLLMASCVIFSFHFSCPWCDVFIVSLTVVLLCILLFAMTIHLQIRVEHRFRLIVKFLSLWVRSILKAVSYP